MNIEFFYIKDCPGYRPARQVLEKILAEMALSCSIEDIEVNSEEKARQYRFLGSPSIRINGRDIEGCEKELGYGLKCRIYSETGSGVPSESLIRNALKAAIE